MPRGHRPKLRPHLTKSQNPQPTTDATAPEAGSEQSNANQTNPALEPESFPDITPSEPDEQDEKKDDTSSSPEPILDSTTDDLTQPLDHPESPQFISTPGRERKKGGLKARIRAVRDRVKKALGGRKGEVKYEKLER